MRLDRKGPQVQMIGVGEAMTAPQTAGHLGTFQQAFEESASGSSVNRTATFGTTAVMSGLAVAFRYADGGGRTQSLTADGCPGEPGNQWGPQYCRFCRGASRSFSELPFVVLLELLVRHIIRMRPVPVRTFEQASPSAERTATQVVSHVPERVIDEPVAGRSSLCSSTPGARTGHSHTSARLDVKARSTRGSHRVPHAGRDVELRFLVAVTEPREYLL